MMVRLLVGAAVGALAWWGYQRWQGHLRSGRAPGTVESLASSVAGGMTGTVPVKELMTRDVVSAPADMPAQEVARLMRSKGVSAVPVGDDEGHVLGMLSDLDLLSRANATAGTCMSTRVVSVTEETTAEELAQLFIN